MKPVAVLKFGGTSVANPELREKVYNHIKSYIEKDYSVVVVVSAMGRKGSPYATDTLINLLPAGYDTGIIKDFICNCGENISAAVLSAEASLMGIDAVPLTGGQAGIITDACYTRANIIRIQPDIVVNHLLNDRVVIISGFQGQTMPEGYVTTLGRGGSDLSALALASALDAEETVIYTDVPGIAYTDPRIVPVIKFISTIPVKQLYWLSLGGARVMHSRAVKSAMEHNVSFYVRATGSTENGTFVDADPDKPFLPFAGITSVPVENDSIQVSVIMSPDSDRVTEMIREYWSEREEKLKVEYFPDNCCLRALIKEESATCFIKDTCGIIFQKANLDILIKEKIHDRIF